MNRNQLRYFVAAAESRSFTKAADQFFISQTAVTQQIRLLEESLGCELFDRSTRPVRLTPAGQVFLLEARAILERSELSFVRKAVLRKRGTEPKDHGEAAAISLKAGMSS